MVDLYPNPAFDAFNIKVNVNREEKVSISLLNNLGQLVKTLYEGYTKQFEQVVNTRSVSSGVYFVKIEGSTENKVVKLVIQK